MADVVEHEVGPDAAIHADDIDLIERFDGDECSGDFRSWQHFFSRVHDGELYHQRQAHPRPFHFFDGGDSDALGLEDVEAGFDKDGIDPFFDHDADLRPIGLGEAVEVDPDGGIGE